MAGGPRGAPGAWAAPCAVQSGRLCQAGCAGPRPRSQGPWGLGGSPCSCGVSCACRDPAEASARGSSCVCVHVGVCLVTAPARPDVRGGPRMCAWAAVCLAAPRVWPKGWMWGPVPVGSPPCADRGVQPLRVGPADRQVRGSWCRCGVHLSARVSAVGKAPLQAWASACAGSPLSLHQSGGRRGVVGGFPVLTGCAGPAAPSAGRCPAASPASPASPAPGLDQKPHPSRPAGPFPSD